MRRDESLSDFIKSIWKNRDDRGAEKRLMEPQREILYSLNDLKADPHREMHKRGG